MGILLDFPLWRFVSPCWKIADLGFLVLRLPHQPAVPPSPVSSPCCSSSSSSDNVSKDFFSDYLDCHGDVQIQVYSTKLCCFEGSRFLCGNLDRCGDVQLQLYSMMVGCFECSCLLIFW